MSVTSAAPVNDTAPSPTVSVVVPVRNRRDLLAELLAALDAQTFSDFETIVVDDGSTDGAGDLAVSFTLAGRPVRVLRQPSLGAVAARTLAVQYSTGSILAFTDSDCRPRPDWLEAGVRAVEAGADVVDGFTMPARPVLSLERSVHQAHDGLYATCNVFYRRAAFDAAGGFDDTAAARLGFRYNARARGMGFGEDTLLGWRVARAGTSAYEPNAVVEHHVFPADFVEWVNRCWMAAAFPALLAAVPELRENFVRRGVLFGTRSRVPVYATAAALITRRRAMVGMAFGWWALTRWCDVRQQPLSWLARLKSVPAEMALDAVMAAALAAGSARQRTLLL